MMKIKYEHLLWIIITVLSSVTVIDRFVWNPWPMGVDNPRFKGPWSVVFFDLCARISGRLSLISTNVIKQSA